MTQISLHPDDSKVTACPKCWYSVSFDNRFELERHFNTEHLTPGAWMWRVRYDFLDKRWYVEQPDSPHYVIQELP
jgi:hypothetical protein